MTQDRREGGDGADVPGAPGWNVGGCRIVARVHRYLVECYRCPNWYAVALTRAVAIAVAQQHNTVEWVHVDDDGRDAP